MNTIPANTLEVLKEVYNELGYPDFQDEDQLQVVEEGQWVSEGKWEHKQDILYSTEHDIYIAAIQGRSGSYYTDYYNEDTQFIEVYPQEVTITKYIPVSEMTKVIAAAKAG